MQRGGLHALVLVVGLVAVALACCESTSCTEHGRAFVQPRARTHGQWQRRAVAKCLSLPGRLVPGGQRCRVVERLRMSVADSGDQQGDPRRRVLPQRLNVLAQWVGSSRDSKEAGLRLVKMGDDFARAHGESLGPSALRSATKVPGCVSVVRIAVSLQDAAGESTDGAGQGEASPAKSGWGLVVEGEADARVARGMLALLAEGLRGLSVQEVMDVDVDVIISTARLQRFLPPGRNNGLANMLAVIQDQACAAGENESTARLHAADAGAGAGDAGAVPSSGAAGPEVDASSVPRQVWAWGGRGQEVAMLLSGGVDSSVAMALLKDQGYRVTAFYLKIWLEDELAHLGECPWQEDWAYASSVAADLGVPLEAVSLQREYWDQVVQYLIDESRRGRTPNPDVMCNSRIKFGMFHDYVGQHFSAIASGHYAQQRLCQDSGRAQLIMSPDRVKDQTYFLCNMNQQQMAHARFPLGGLQKSQVRDLAHSYSLATEARKDSQGICFLGKLKFEDFVGHHLGDMPGDVVELGSGRLLGQHRGLWYHTIGQRKGLGGATRQFTHEGPWFVAGKDVESNKLFVTNVYEAIEAPRRAFDVEDINWIAGVPPALHGGELDLRVKTRHGPNMHECKLELGGVDLRDGRVQLADRDSGLAPGQWAVFYNGQECLGGGVIGESSFMPSDAGGKDQHQACYLGAHGNDTGGQDEFEVLFREDS